jgi:hypothetical protein
MHGVVQQSSLGAASFLQATLIRKFDRSVLAAMAYEPRVATVFVGTPRGSVQPP